MISNGQYGVQICSMVLIVLLIYLCVRRRSLGLHSTQVFFNALVASVITIGLDYATVWAIHHYDQMDPLAGTILFKMYSTSLGGVAFFGFYYAVNSLTSGNDIRKRFSKISVGFVILGTILIWVLPLKVTDREVSYYLYGPSVITIYIVATIFVVSTAVFSIVFRKRMNRRSFVAIQLWLLIWMAAIILQSLYTKAPITSFCIAIGYTVIFAELENPQGFIDRETGVFNAHALIDAINQRYMRDEVFAAIDVIIELRERDYDRDQKRILLSTLSGRLDKIPDVQVFRNVSDEFVLLFQDEETMEDAWPKVKDAMERKINTLPSELSFSVFYLLFPDSSLAGSAEEMFRLHGFFHRKDTDRDYMVIDEASVKEIKRDLDIRSLIMKAISEDRLEIYYQPIYSVSKGSFTSAEALARIRDENGEIVMPSEFIPIAEESGMILQLGRMVFEKVCKFIHDGDMVSLGMSYIGINLSVEQCEHKTLAAEFQKIMKEYAVDPRRINLEITESGSISSRKVLVDNMNTLIKSGVHFSLDDFGTGQSNLDYVMNMPVQIIKFDRTLIRDYFENDRTRFVFGAVSRMVKDMGLEIVCEGVETREQYDELHNLGIDLIQGFYFSRPLPEKEFIYFVEQRNKEA